MDIGLGKEEVMRQSPRTLGTLGSSGPSAGHTERGKEVAGLTRTTRSTRSGRACATASASTPPNDSPSKYAGRSGGLPPTTTSRYFLRWRRGAQSVGSDSTFFPPMLESTDLPLTPILRLVPASPLCIYLRTCCKKKMPAKGQCRPSHTRGADWVSSSTELTGDSTSCTGSSGGRALHEGDELGEGGAVGAGHAEAVQVEGVHQVGELAGGRQARAVDARQVYEQG